jgi:hypothetical protein
VIFWGNVALNWVSAVQNLKKHQHQTPETDPLIGNQEKNQTNLYHVTHSPNLMVASSTACRAYAAVKALTNKTPQDKD